MIASLNGFRQRAIAAITSSMMIDIYYYPCQRVDIAREHSSFDLFAKNVEINHK